MKETDMICPYCHGDVLFVDGRIVGMAEGMNVYVCENYWYDPNGDPIPDELIHDHTIKRLCDAYVRAHSPNSKFGNANQPIGRMADAHLRKVRNETVALFYRFWKHKIINEVWGMVVAYKTEEGGKMYAKRIDTDGKTIVLEFIGTDTMLRVPIEKTETITARTKAYLWLIEEMNKIGGNYEYGTFSLQNLNEDELIRAYNIINKTIKDNETRN